MTVEDPAITADGLAPVPPCSERAEIRARARFDDIGRETVTGVDLVADADAQMDLTLRVLARRHRFDVVILQLARDAGRHVDRLQQRIDRSVACPSPTTLAPSRLTTTLRRRRLAARDIDPPLDEVDTCRPRPAVGR